MAGEEKKGCLIDLLIHDLGGPLSVVATTVLNLLEKAERYGPLTDRQKGALERILRNSRRAQSLIQEMLEISRSKEGIFQRERIRIGKILKESLLEAMEAALPDIADNFCRIDDEKEFQCLLETQGIFVEMSGKYSRSPFCHDQRKVQQILRNLISNAMKYRRRRLKLSVHGDFDLIISVEDDGIGIPPGDQEIIFKRFVRLKDKKGIDLPGVGLGLAGVKALVEAMGGEITLVSREEAGTRFTVRIPPL